MDLPRPTSATLHQFKVESGINGAPCGLPPIYSVSTLSWLRSALERLPSFALDACSLATSLPGIKRKTYCHHPINFESNSLPLDRRESAISRPVRRKKGGWFFESYRPASQRKEFGTRNSFSLGWRAALQRGPNHRFFN
jgi:hypothetical protein